MKRKFCKYVALVILIFISLNSFSQDSHHIPAWVSSKGYWVIENNLYQPLENNIRFYNNENVLIGKTTISGIKLDVKKKKVKMQLKAMLESSVMAWNKEKAAGSNIDVANKP